MSTLSTLIASSGGGGIPLGGSANFVNKGLKFTDENGIEWLKQGTLMVDPTNQYPNADKKLVSEADPAVHGHASFGSRSQNRINGVMGPNGNIFIGAYYRGDAYQNYYSYGQFKDVSTGLSPGSGTDGYSFPGSSSNYKYYGVNYFHVPNAPVGVNSAANTYNKMAMYMRAYGTDMGGDVLITGRLTGWQSSATTVTGHIEGQQHISYMRNAAGGGHPNHTLFYGMNGGNTQYSPMGLPFYDHVNEKMYVLCINSWSKTISNGTQLHEYDWSGATNFKTNGTGFNNYQYATSSILDPLGLATTSDAEVTYVDGIMSDETYVYISYRKLLAGTYYYNLRRFPMNGLTNGWASGTDVMTDHLYDVTIWKPSTNVANVLEQDATSYSPPIAYGGLDTNGDAQYIRKHSSLGYKQYAQTESFGSSTAAVEGQAYSYVRIK